MSNRSGSPYSAPRDANHVPFLLAASTADGITPVVLEADPTTHALVTSGSGGGSSTVTITSPIGATTSSASVSVTPATDANVAKETGGNLATIASNTTGIATATNQTTMNTSLSSIVTNTTGIATSSNQTNGSQQTKITDGTTIVSVVSGDTGFNGLSAAAATKSYTFTTSSSGAQVIGPYNCEGFSHITIHITTNTTSGLNLAGQFSQTIGGTYNNVSSFIDYTTVNGNIGGIGSSSGHYYTSPVIDNYFQLNVPTLVSGTFAGTVTLSNKAMNNPAGQVYQGGTWKVNPGVTSTGSITSVASANTSIQLLASNTSRSAAYFFNDSTAILYIAFASSASTTAYTVQVAASGFFEMPTIPVYTGAIFGIWATANGNVRITELA